MGAIRHLLPGLLLFLFFVEFGISDHTAAASSTTILRCPETERKALIHFKRLLRDPSDRLSSWVGEDCCGGWEGVKCSNTTGHVVKLDLRNHNYTSDECFYDDDDSGDPYYLGDEGCKQALRGEISSSLLSLRHLTHLDLSGNHFGHPIPAFFGSLTRLAYLNLSSSGFIGRVPDQLGNLSALNYLDISYNEYYDADYYGGYLYLKNPGWISRLSSLRLLNMSSVYFTGSSDWLQALNALPLIREVELASCDLGPFPRSLPNSNLSSLTTLNLGGSLMNSTAPNWLLNITTLEYLDLHWNYISWNDPASLAKLASLKKLDLSRNLFISDDFLRGALSNLCMLQGLYLNGVGDNDVLSKLEVAFSGCLMLSLEELDLRYNQFNGSLPQWLANMENLQYLSLSYASLNGSLPPWLGSMKNLKYLDLSRNSFYGSLPVSLGNLSSLQYLSLNSNNFNGTIVEGIQYDGSSSNLLWNMKNLKHLDLSYNSFYGPLPVSLGNLSSLQYLDMSANLFNGTIAQGMELDGSFSDLPWNMKNLEHLDLSYNSFYGPLPLSPVNLLSLQHLNLRFNNLIWSVKQGVRLNNSFLDWFGRMKKLKSLDLSYNLFSGSLPASFGNLSSLLYLDLGSNSLNGSIGEGIPKLKDLIRLDLQNNSMNIFEVNLTNLSSLKYLDISYNTLVLEEDNDLIPQFQLILLDMSHCRIIPVPYFPRWLCTQKSLIDLYISNAGIKGMVPNWLPPGLNTLYLYNNKISGGMVQYLPKLTSLYLSNNSFSGHVQYQRMANMMLNLEFLDLSSNKLNGEVPTSFPKLRYMLLSNNSFSGHIPLKISLMMQNLLLLDLSMNNLSGSIPWSLCQNKFLRVIKLSNNSLSEEIPNCWKNSLNAFTLDFSNNQLQGGIPSTLCNMWNLHSLHLSHNNLSGEIPSSLRNCTNLVTLDLGNNNFIGNIPTWLEDSLPYLKTLNLRSNVLTGYIPGLSHLAHLQILDISNNYLFGGIPYSFGNFNALKNPLNYDYYFKEDEQHVYRYEDDIWLIVKSYYYEDDIWLFVKGFEFQYKELLTLVTLLDLSNNNLSGSIPEELGNLHGLQNLNLSGNHLMGEIPENIGRIKPLETLDLSRNNLSGAIPLSLTTLNFLSHLNLSQNNLSGRILTSNQFQTFNDPSIYDGNLYLCGPPLTKNCTDDDTRNNINEDEEDKERMEIVWLYTWATIGFIIGFWIIWGPLLFKQRWRIFYFQTIDDAYDLVYVTMMVKLVQIKQRLFS